METNPEIQLILYCLSLLQDKQSVRHSSLEPDFQKINWDNFIDLSSRHKLMPLVAQAINQTDKIRFPNKIKSRIKNIYKSNLVKNFFLSSKLIHILNLMENNHIKCIPFKGPALSEFVYKDLALRQFSDLDLLISRKDAPKAMDIFSEYGFNLQIDLKQNQFKTYSKIKGSIELWHKTSRIHVDLHWEFTGNYSIKPFELEYVQPRLVPLNFLNKQILHLSKVDTIVCLCLHGAKNIWDNLENIYCVSLLSHNITENDEQCLLKTCNEKRCRKIVAAGIYLCIHFFKINLSSEIKNYLFVYPDLDKITQPLIQLLSSGKPWEKSKTYRFSKFNLIIRDCFIDKVQYGLRMLFLPSFVDWDKYNFSQKLSLFYFLTRPLRLARNYLQNDNKRKN